MLSSASYFSVRTLHIYRWLLITTAILLAFELIPKRTYNLLNNHDERTLFSGADGESKVYREWLSTSNIAFRCTFDHAAEAFPYCGMNIQFGEDERHGSDFSNFSKLKLKVSYTGSSQRLRLFVRNYSELYVNREGDHTAKYMSLEIPVYELEQEVEIPMKNFTVASWWAGKQNPVPTLSHTEFNNVTHIGVDFPHPVQAGRHEIRVESMKIEGIWVARQHWYLSVVIVWLFTLTVIWVGQFVRFRRHLALSEDPGDQLLRKANLFKQIHSANYGLPHSDPTTGALSRRGCKLKVTQLQHQKHWTGTGLILLVIDNFSLVENRQDFQACEALVVETYTLLKKFIHGPNACCRWSEDEFLLIIPDHKSQDMALLAEKIRRTIGAIPFEDGRTLIITVTASVVNVQSGEELEDAIRRLDRLLCDAIAAGGNCVR